MTAQRLSCESQNEMKDILIKEDVEEGQEERETWMRHGHIHACIVSVSGLPSPPPLPYLPCVLFFNPPTPYSSPPVPFFSSPLVFPLTLLSSLRGYKTTGLIAVWRPWRLWWFDSHSNGSGIQCSVCSSHTGHGLLM